MNKIEITLNQALQLQAQRFPHKIFLYHKNATYTFSETKDLVDRFAAYLEDKGVRLNDKVCFMLPRIPELVIAFLASTKIGANPVPVNHLLPPKIALDLIRRIAPKVVVSSAKLVSPEIDTGLGHLQITCIDTSNTKNGWIPWRIAIAGKYAGDDLIAQPGNLAYLNYTTGSSGIPKGGLTTHANIYWNTRSAVEAFNLNADDVHLCMFASFAHPHELFARPLYTGASVVLQEELNPKTIIRTIYQYSVSCVMGLAPMYQAMVTHCGSMQVGRLRIAESGGMYTRRDLCESFCQSFGLPLLSVWGSTETTGVALANTETAFRKDGSMGKGCPHYQVKLIGEDGHEVTASGEVGEMFIRGGGVIRGYDNGSWCQMDGGWYASGDMARRDNDGFYYFIERKSGMIKLAGLKVYPLQIELCLLEHPDIADVAVLGAPDERKGSALMAFVEAKGNKSLGSDDLLAFCKGKLPSYMIPKTVRVVASLPKIGSGKLDKRALIETLSRC